MVGSKESLRAELDAAFRQVQDAAAEFRALCGDLPATQETPIIRLAGQRCKESTEHYLEVLRRYNDFLGQVIERR